MPDLRFSTFRVRVYTEFAPSDLPDADRQRFLDLVEKNDEQGMEAFFAGLTDTRCQHVVRILREARSLGDRLNVMDRTIPALPHNEIGECYGRLRALGDEVDDLAESPRER
jgi:hypothetical protein